MPTPSGAVSVSWTSSPNRPRPPEPIRTSWVSSWSTQSRCLAPDVSNGLFGVEKGKAVWRCSRCFTRNPIETNGCSECGLPYIESAKREAAAFTEQLSQDSARTTVGIVGWSARIMMVIGGLLAPVVLFWTALAGRRRLGAQEGARPGSLTVTRSLNRPSRKRRS